MDTTEITPRLWIGSAPQPGRRVAHAGFDVLVLAAYEYQPAPRLFPNLKRIIYCPIDDAELSAPHAAMVEECAHAVERELRAGKKVLVTCAAGRNRSGVILSRALILAGHSPAFVVATVQAKRENALSNPSFVSWLLHGRLRTDSRPTRTFARQKRSARPE